MAGKAEIYYKWTRLTVGVIIAAVILIFLFRQCGHSDNVGVAKSDTIKIRHDTVIHTVDTFISYVPTPYKVEVPTQVPVYIGPEPTYRYLPIDSFPPQVKKIISDYYSRKYYDTTLSIQYGTAHLKDTVYANKITGRGWSINQSIPEITNTITLREPKRNIVYLGAGIFGNLNTPFAGTEASISLKNKQDVIYNIKGMLLKNQSTLYGVTVLLPLRLKKRG